MKQFIYKVYDASGNFLETIDDVISEPRISQEINSAGSEMVLRLARKPTDYGEGGSIEFNNIIKVYIKDKEYTTPTLHFEGRIVSYTPIYDDNAGVELTVYSMGYELNSYIYKTTETEEQIQNSGSSEQGVGNGDKLAQSFIPDQPTLTSVELKMRVIAPITLTVSIHKDSSGSPNTTAITNGTATKSVTNTSATVHKLNFATPPTLVVGDTYWLQVTI